MGWESIEARNRVIEDHLWVPRMYALRTFKSLNALNRLLVVDYEDLYQVGAIGLIQAVDRMRDALKPCLAFIKRRVFGAIEDYLRTFPYVTRRQAVQAAVRTRVDVSVLEWHPAPSDLEFVEARVTLDKLRQRLSGHRLAAFDGLMRGLDQQTIATSLNLHQTRVSQYYREIKHALSS